MRVTFTGGVTEATSGNSIKNKPVHIEVQTGEGPIKYEASTSALSHIFLYQTDLPDGSYQVMASVDEDEIHAPARTEWIPFTVGKMPVNIDIRAVVG